MVIFLPVILAAAIAYRLVPVGVPQKPITSPQQIRMLRKLSFIFLAAWFFVGFLAYISGHTALTYFVGGNLGLLWQTFMLTAPGFHFITAIERVFTPKNRHHS